MKKKKIIILITAFCLSQLFVQCTHDNNKIKEKTETEQYTDEVILLRNFLSTSLQIDMNKIIYDSGKSSFIIDGDVLMSLEDARDRFNHLNSKNTNKTNQRLNHNKMSPEMAVSVTVFIAPEVSTE